MNNYTLKSFIANSDNNRFDGGELIIEYELTSYEQTDKKKITVSVNFNLQDNFENIESIDSSIKLISNNTCDEWASIKGSCTFSIIDDIDLVDDDPRCGYVSFTNCAIESIDGKIWSVKFIPESDSFTEKDLQDIEFKLQEFYYNNAMVTLKMVAEYYRLKLIREV